MSECPLLTRLDSRKKEQRVDLEPLGVTEKWPCPSVPCHPIVIHWNALDFFNWSILDFQCFSTGFPNFSQVIRLYTYIFFFRFFSIIGLSWWLSWKRIHLQCGRPGFYPWVEKILGEGKGYPLQYSGLENSMDCAVHGITKCRTWLSLSLFIIGYYKILNIVPCAIQ